MRRAAFAGLMLIASASTFAAEPGREAGREVVNFDRDIRPILSDTCYACHGPDDAQRKAGLRLDQKAAAFALRDGGPAVVPGKLDKSELYRRITSTDPEERMPPPNASRSLSAGQVDLIRRWIEQGAAWEEHWSLVPPKRSAAPSVKARDRLRTAIDAYLLTRLERDGLSFSADADKSTLLRRVTLDLTGLPPTLDEIAAFEADHSPNAYEKVVDRLLASPRYGERMAIRWLDAARYADTNGYQTDGERVMWRWRDWVIDALNAGMPFDQFSIEQLAGDLLPNPTLDQRIATGFNRNHRGNSEGGIIPEEYQVEYVVDRAETTATVWLGLTMGCARCHDHKYDPIRQQEFYGLFAFFNNIPEQGRAIKVGNSVPVLKAPTADNQRTLAALEARLADAKRRFAARAEEIDRKQAAWEAQADANIPESWSIDVGKDGARWMLDDNLEQGNRHNSAAKFQGVGGSPAYVAGRSRHAVKFDGKTILDAGDFGNFGYFDRFTLAAWIRPASADAGTIVSRMKDNEAEEGYSLDFDGGRVRVQLVKRPLDDAIRIDTERTFDCDAWHHVAMCYDGSRTAAGVQIYVDGAPQKCRVLLDELNQTFLNDDPLRIGGAGNPKTWFHGTIDDVAIYDRDLSPVEMQVLATSDDLSTIRSRAQRDRTAGQAAKLRQFFLQHRADDSLKNAIGELRQLETSIVRLEESFPTVMVMEEMAQPRATHVLLRGQYDRPGQAVSPGVPACLPVMAGNAPKNRLTLARWLMDPVNPLTARVAANRQWQTIFGEGLVRTGEDFGSQGARPSHPDLLDWLATELVRLRWDVKAFHRLMVTSTVYRQGSAINPQIAERDRDNRLLSHAPRQRLSAEMVRDQALAAGGLLVERLGGPSAKPYQPEGLWSDLTASEYKQDRGEGLYRRSLYTYWKRTVAPPAMMAFDASSRETCTVRETRTNTPLQALNLLNDVTYVEAARNLAERVLDGANRLTVSQRLERMFRTVLTRRPNSPEQQVLERGLARRFVEYRNDPAAAKKLLGVGESPVRADRDPAELAAYTATALLILNLDEAVTKE